MNNYIKFLFLLLLAACKSGPETNTGPGEINLRTIERHIERLASDEFLGRMPLTEGETKTINYLKDEFENLGLLPGNGDSYFQDVPVIEITGTPSGKMSFSGPNGVLNINYFDDFVAFTSKADNEVNLENSELVYPNPSEGELHINNPSTGKFSYEIFTINGKLVASRRNITGSTTTVDMSGFAKGAYFVDVRTAEKTETHKIILK